MGKVKGGTTEKMRGKEKRERERESKTQHRKAHLLREEKKMGTPTKEKRIMRQDGEQEGWAMGSGAESREQRG